MPFAHGAATGPPQNACVQRQIYPHRRRASGPVPHRTEVSAGDQRGDICASGNWFPLRDSIGGAECEAAGQRRSRVSDRAICPRRGDN